MRQDFPFFRRGDPLLRADPWAQLYQWRHNQIWSRKYVLRHAFPGIGYGFGLFLVACAAEALYYKNIEDDHHH